MLTIPDEAVVSLLRLAQPLSPIDRSKFWELVHDRLSDFPAGDLGVRLIHRIAAEIQAMLLRPMADTERPPKWARLPGRPRKDGGRNSTISTKPPVVITSKPRRKLAVA